MGCHSLLQGIFPTQGSNLGLPHCRQILYHLSHQESPLYIKFKNRGDECMVLHIRVAINLWIEGNCLKMEAQFTDYLFYTTKLIFHRNMYINHQKWWDKKEELLAGTCLTLWNSAEWNVELIHTIICKASVQTWYNPPLPKAKINIVVMKNHNIMQYSDKERVIEEQHKRKI